MAMVGLTSREKKVLNSLSEFVQYHQADAQLSAIDDIILSYIVGVLEDIGNDDVFDIDSFIEMIGAYMTDFEWIDRGKVCDWVFKLAEELSLPQEKENTPPSSAKDKGASYPNTLEKCSRMTLESRPLHDNQNAKDSEKETAMQQDEKLGTSEDCQVQLLLELFPAACSIDAKRCLSIAQGDTEGAAQLLMDKIDNGEIKSSPRSHIPEVAKNLSIKEEKKKRDLILQKYGYVDMFDDEREHKPMAPKEEGKKLVRYLNNQKVTTKGERFIEIKKPSP